jgi:excisionase family DNA binding protein
MEARLGMLRKPLLTLQETADLLKLSHATLRALIKAGDVRAIRIGREWRIAVRDLEEFLDAHANRAPATRPSEPQP